LDKKRNTQVLWIKMIVLENSLLGFLNSQIFSDLK